MVKVTLSANLLLLWTQNRRNEVKLAMEALALLFMYCVTLNGNFSFALGNATDRERNDVLWTWSHKKTQALYPRLQIAGMRHHDHVPIYNLKKAWSTLVACALIIERVYRKKLSWLEKNSWTINQGRCLSCLMALFIHISKDGKWQDYRIPKSRHVSVAL